MAVTRVRVSEVVAYKHVCVCVMIVVLCLVVYGVGTYCGSCSNVSAYMVLWVEWVGRVGGQPSRLCREVADYYGERGVDHYVVSTVHGADLVVVEQDFVVFESEKNLELRHNKTFHLCVLGEDEGTAKAYAMRPVVRSRYTQHLRRLDISQRGFRQRCF